MSIPTATATTPSQRSIMDVTILLLRRAQHNAPKIVSIVGLLAAALTANIADAATWSHHRYYRASAPERNWIAETAPAYYSRYDRGVVAPSQVTPFSGRGSFEEKDSAP